MEKAITLLKHAKDARERRTIFLQVPEIMTREGRNTALLFLSHKVVLLLSKELPDTACVNQASCDIALAHSFSSPVFVFETPPG